MTAKEFIEQIGAFTNCDLQFRVIYNSKDFKPDPVSVHSFELVSINGTPTIQIDLLGIDQNE